jgi:hypothetical protein
LPVCVAGGMTGSHTKMMREKLNRIGAMRKGARSGGQAPLLGLAPGGGTRESGAVPMASIERGIDHSAEDSYRQPASTCGAKSPLFGSVPPNHPPLFGSVPPNHPLLGRLRKRAKPSGKGKTPGDRPRLSWGFLAAHTSDHQSPPREQPQLPPKQVPGDRWLPLGPNLGAVLTELS